MKKVFASISLLGLVASFPIFAVLPPLYQGIAELKAILNDEQLSEHLHSGEVILEIQKADRGYYIITNKQQIFVEVVAEPQNKPGPEKFHLVFKSTL